MAVFLIGILIFLFPLLLTFLEEDLLQGILKVSAGLIGFSVAIALVTQALHIFTYPIVLSAFILADLGVARTLFLKAPAFKKGLRTVSKPGALLAALLPLLVFAIFGFELYTIHYQYTGEVGTLRGTNQVSKNAYGYPLFSDEWVEAALVHQSIHSASLPLTDPLAEHKPLTDLLAPFHATLAEAFLLTGLDPIMEFAVLAITTGLLVLGAFYVCVRALGVGYIASLIVLVTAPLLAQAGNLPGLWFLLPYLGACIPFFLSLASFAKKSYGIGCINAALAVILYPPLIVFSAPSVLVALFTDRDKPFRKISAFIRTHATPISISTIVAIALVSFLIAVLPSSIRSLLIENIASGLHHPNLEGGLISFPLWVIFPYILLPFAAASVFAPERRDRLFFLITPVIGLAFWCLYAFYRGVIIIEYPRIVAITSFFLLIAAGLGIEYVFKLIGKRYVMEKMHQRVISIPALIGLLIASGLLIPVYSRVVLRGQFILSTSSGKNTVLYVPLPAITRYITSDDLAIWNRISQATFIAPEWKSLVIGAATGNYPLDTKPSFITENALSYDRFMESSCQEKKILATDFHISYAYSESFSCPGFTGVATSSENLVLYLYTS